MGYISDLIDSIEGKDSKHNKHDKKDKGRNPSMKTSIGKDYNYGDSTTDGSETGNTSGDGQKRGLYTPWSLNSSAIICGAVISLGVWFLVSHKGEIDDTLHSNPQITGLGKPALS